MKTNKIAYLGFLGLLGLLGLYKPYLFALCNFFTLFIFFENDERAEKNIGLASRNALLFYTTLSTIMVLFTATTETFDLLPIFVVLLSLGVTIFGASYAYYNRRGE